MILLNRFAIWDLFAEQAWLLVLTGVIISVLIYLVIFRKLFSLLLPATNFLNKVQSALLLFIVIPAVLTVPLFGSLGGKYGRTSNPPVFLTHDRQHVYVISNRERTGKSVYTNYRLHKIETATGNETERYLLERNLNKYPYALIGNIFWVELLHKNKLTGVDIINGDRHVIDEEYLRSVDSISNRTGIQNFTVDFSKPVIQIFRKDGSDVFVNPFEVINGAKSNFQPRNKTQFNGEFRLSDEARAKLFRGNELVLPDKTWINGRILMQDSVNNQLIIAGYKTTENEEAVIECYTSGLKKVWEITTPEIPEGEIGECLQTDESILLFAGTTLISIDRRTGKLKWDKEM